MPQPSTDTNDIVLKVLYTVAEGMHQNGGALHTTDRMLDKDADLTEGFILSLLLNTSLGTGVLLTLARFLCRHVHLLTAVIRLDTSRASVDTNMQIDTPIHLRWKLLFQHGVIVIVTTKGPTKKNDQLVRQGHDGVFQRMLFFFPL